MNEKSPMNPEENEGDIEYDDLNEFDIMEQILHPDGQEDE